MAQLEMYEAIANSPHTTLVNSIDETQTEIIVLDASVLPNAPNLLVIGYDKDNAETCLYTNIIGNTITIQRATEGIASSFDADTKIARVFTSKDYNSLVRNIKDLNTQQIAMSIALS